MVSKLLDNGWTAESLKLCERSQHCVSINVSIEVPSNIPVVFSSLVADRFERLLPPGLSVRGEGVYYISKAVRDVKCFDILDGS